MELKEKQTLALRSLRKTSPDASVIFAEFAQRERARNEITVDLLCRKLRLSRHQVVHVFKLLALLGLGRFIKGARGFRSRFRFDVPAPLVGRAAF